MATYRMVESVGGAVIAERVFDNKAGATEFYVSHTTGDSSVRAYINGKKLTYLKSDKMFGVTAKWRAMPIPKRKRI